MPARAVKAREGERWKREVSRVGRGGSELVCARYFSFTFHVYVHVHGGRTGPSPLALRRHTEREGRNAVTAHKVSSRASAASRETSQAAYDSPEAQVHQACDVSPLAHGACPERASASRTGSLGRDDTQKFGIEFLTRSPFDSLRSLKAGLRDEESLNMDAALRAATIVFLTLR
jgi:hypothetical protein